MIWRTRTRFGARNLDEIDEKSKIDFCSNSHLHSANIRARAPKNRAQKKYENNKASGYSTLLQSRAAGFGFWVQFDLVRIGVGAPATRLITAGCTTEQQAAEDERNCNIHTRD